MSQKNSSYIAPKFKMRSKVRTRPYAGAFCQLMRLPPESWWRPSPKGILYAVLWWMQYWQASQKFCKKTRTVNWLLPSTPGFASSGWRSIITTSSAGNRWHQNCHGDSPESSEWTAAPTSVLKIRKNLFTSVTQPQLSKRHGSLKSKAKNLVWRPAWRLARKKSWLTLSSWVRKCWLTSSLNTHSNPIQSYRQAAVFHTGKDIFRVKSREPPCQMPALRLTFLKGNQHHVAGDEKGAGSQARVNT